MTNSELKAKCIEECGFLNIKYGPPVIVHTKACKKRAESHKKQILAEDPNPRRFAFLLEKP